MTENGCPRHSQSTAVTDNLPVGSELLLPLSGAGVGPLEATGTCTGSSQGPERSPGNFRFTSVNSFI